MVKSTKKSSGDNSSDAEKKFFKLLEELKNPKPPIRAVGYFISDDGETKIEIGFKK